MTPRLCFLHVVVYITSDESQGLGLRLESHNPQSQPASCISTFTSMKHSTQRVCEWKMITTLDLSISTTDHTNPLQRISNPHPKRKTENAHLSVDPHLFLTQLREILILTLNLLLDPQQHGGLPLVQFLHLIELEQTVCENILVAGFDGFFEIVEELEFAGGGELCVFGAVFVKGAGGGYHVLWRERS